MSGLLLGQHQKHRHEVPLDFSPKVDRHLLQIIWKLIQQPSRYFSLTH